MAAPKKGLLALMVGTPKGGGEDKGGGEGNSDKVDAVREFFEAGKAGDYEEAALAFERAYDACGMHDEDEEEEEPEEEE